MCRNPREQGLAHKKRSVNINYEYGVSGLWAPLEPRKPAQEDGSKQAEGWDDVLIPLA